MLSSLSRNLYLYCFVKRPPAGFIVFADTVGVFLQRKNGLKEVWRVQVHKWQGTGVMSSGLCRYRGDLRRGGDLSRFDGRRCCSR